MAVPVELGATVTPGSPVMLFRGSYPAPNTGGALYDVSQDGQRFLMIKNAAVETAQQIVVVQNWHEELRRLVPAD